MIKFFTIVQFQAKTTIVDYKFCFLTFLLERRSSRWSAGRSGALKICSERWSERRSQNCSGAQLERRSEFFRSAVSLVPKLRFRQISIMYDHSLVRYLTQDWAIIGVWAIIRAGAVNRNFTVYLYQLR